MTLEELKGILQTTGLPVTYRAWPENEAPALPFLCFLYEGSNNVYADGEVYYTSCYVRVELYTATKSPETEALVETALAGFHWDKSEVYISTERCYLITYEIEV